MNVETSRAPRPPLVLTVTLSEFEARALSQGDPKVMGVFLSLLADVLHRDA